MIKKQVGIVFADEMEYAPFRDYALSRGATERTLCGCRTLDFSIASESTQIKVTAIESGIGKVCAASATTALILEGADIILNAGLSGAVSGCKREQLVVGDSYCECDMDLTAIGYKPGEKVGCPVIYQADSELLSLAKGLGLTALRLGTGDIFLTDKEKKDYYLNTFKIGAFDMETAAIACVCHKCGIPMLSMRKISDDADDSAVNDYTEMNDLAESTLTEVLASLLAALL